MFHFQGLFTLFEDYSRTGMVGLFTIQRCLRYCPFCKTFKFLLSRHFGTDVNLDSLDNDSVNQKLIEETN